MSDNDENNKKTCPKMKIRIDTINEVFKKVPNPVSSVIHYIMTIILIAIGFIILVFCGLILSTNKALDLPYIFKRGEYLFKFKDKETGEDTSFGKVWAIVDVIYTILNGDKKTFGAQAFQTKNEENLMSENNAAAKKIGEANNTQSGGDNGNGNDNNSNNNENNDIPQESSALAQQKEDNLASAATSKEEAEEGDKIIVKYEDVTGVWKSVEFLVQLLNTIVFGETKIYTKNIVIDYVHTYVKYIHEDDEYLRKFINNNFLDLPTIIVSLNLINIMELIGNKLEFDEKILSDMENIQIPKIQTDIYGGDNDPIFNFLLKDDPNFEEMYKKGMLSSTLLDLNKPLNDIKPSGKNKKKETDESPSSNNQQQQPVEQSGETNTSKPTESDQTTDSESSPTTESESSPTTESESGPTTDSGETKEKSLINKMRNKTLSALDTAKGVGQKIGDTAVSTSSAISSAKDYIKDTSLKQKGKNASKLMGDVASSVGHKMGDVASSVGQKMGDAASSVGQKVSDKIFGTKEERQEKKEARDLRSELNKGKLSENKVDDIKGDIQSKINEMEEGDSKKKLEESMEIVELCKDDPVYHQKALKLALLRDLPNNPTYEGFNNVYESTGMLSNYTLTYGAQMVNFFIPRVFHSLNKILNIFEYHNLGAVFIQIYSRLLSEEIVKIKEVDNNDEKTISQRLKYIEQYMMELLKNKSFKSMKEGIKKVLLYGYMKYDLQISKLDNLKPKDKYYLKIFSEIIKNMRIKNQLLDMLEKYYLNNTEASRYSLNQKDIWFQRYYNIKTLPVLYKKYKFKKYKDLPNEQVILLFNNYISYCEAMYILINPQKAGYFLLGEKESNNKKQIQGGYKNNKLYIKTLDEFINENIEVFYNKSKILKKNKGRKTNLNKKYKKCKIILKKNKKEKTKKRKNKRKKRVKNLTKKLNR